MVLAPVPVDDERRRIELLSFNILDSDEEEVYAALVNLAADICNCEGAAISFIDHDRQWFKSSINIPLKEMPRDISFCGHTFLQSDLMIVNNTTVDERFSDNPLVIGDFKVGFYAGAPIINSSGYKLGTVCVLDHKPKHASLSANQKKALTSLSMQVMHLLELRVKNMLVTQQAEQLLKAEKKIARLNTLNVEKQNDHIAYELHENIAQVIAAAKMKLSRLHTGKTTYNIDIKDLQDYLSLMLKDIKSLCHRVTPTTLKSSDYGGYIMELIADTIKSEEVSITFHYNPDEFLLTENFGLNIFRMIQYFLDYSLLAGGKTLTITLAEGLGSLVMAHDGITDLSNSDEATLLLNNIQTRAEIIDSVYLDEDAGRLIKVKFKY